MTFFSVFLLLSSLSLLFCSQIDATENLYGASVDLMHRDSPQSPLYNPSQTQYDRMQNALRRSISRGHRFSALTLASPRLDGEPPVVDVVPADGEYLMNISIGTPPFQILAVADTGSDIIWTQCQPCDHCYKQDAPLFDPRKSSSCRELVCGDPMCKAISGGTTCAPSNSLPKCPYFVSYGDQSYSNGAVMGDTFTLASANKRPVVLNGIAFGCGTNNDGTFNSLASGIVGLGGSPPSLISQMGSLVRGKFSYCLVPLENQSSISKMNFGLTGLVKGEGAVSTKLVKKEISTFYYLTLDGISVGSNRIDLTTNTSEDPTNEGNIIIDSGTTLTLLPQDFYDKIEKSVIKQVKNKKRVNDPSKILNLCYESETNVVTPQLMAHFSGADVKLKGINSFIRVSDGIVCLAFAPHSDVSIWGNVAQMNFLVGYDLEAQTVSFKPKDCTLP